MNGKKRRLEPYSFYDHTGIAAHLQRMAERGWLIESLSNLGWVYRRSEPKQLQFCVTYYPRASEFDPEPSEGQQTFQEFCRHTGWILAASYAQMQIFYNEQEDPVPIETDPELALDTLHRAVKWSFLFPYLLLLAVSLINGALFLSSCLTDPVNALASGSQLFAGLAYVLLLLLCMAELGGYALWRHSAKAAARQGIFLETTRHARTLRYIKAATLLLLACWLVFLLTTASALARTIGLLMLLYTAALILLVNAVKHFLKKKKAPAGLNRALTLLASFALAFAMVGAITYITLRASRSGIFDSRRETYQYQGQTFTLSDDELPLTVEDLTNAAPWGALDAYQLHWSSSILENYLLCYEDRIVRIRFSWEPTPEQMAVVGEMLGREMPDE